MTNNGADSSAHVFAFAYGDYTGVGASGSIGTVVLSNTGASAFLYSVINAGDNVGAVTLINNGYEADASANIYAGDAGATGSIGAITMTATGDHARTEVSAFASGGNIGNITGTVTGVSASAFIHAYATNANIGNITFTATGAQFSSFVYAFAEQNFGISVMSPLPIPVQKPITTPT